MANQGFDYAYSRHLFQRYKVARLNDKIGFSRIGILSCGYRFGFRHPRLYQDSSNSDCDETPKSPSCLLVGSNAYGSGLAFIRSLGKQGINCYAALSDASALPLGSSRFCTLAIPLHAESEIELGEMLIEWVRFLKVDCRSILIADSDPTTRAVAHVRERISKYCHPIVPNDFILKTMLNKKEANPYVKKLGIKVPNSVLVNSKEMLEQESRELKYPIIAKPTRHGAKSIGFKAKIFHSRDDLILFSKKIKSLENGTAELLLQEYIGGPDHHVLSYMFYRNYNSSQIVEWTGIKQRQSPPNAGIMAFGKSIDLPVVREISRKIVNAVDYRSFGGIEYKQYGKDYYFIEMNTRVEANHALAIKSGIDLPWIAYQDVVLETRGNEENVQRAASYFNAQSYLKIMLKPRGIRMAIEDICRFMLVRNKIWSVWNMRDPIPWLSATAVGIIRAMNTCVEILIKK
jgi:predicted ATP-grasp superfamily ATP-dependent carboligase